MTDQLYILGSQSRILNYHLNSQFSNLKRIIITSDVILDSFKGSNVSGLFSSLSSLENEDYFTQLEQVNLDTIFQEELSNEIYVKIQENLGKISQDLDVKLKDYSFMNSISNVRFNLVLRCSDFCLRHYYVEKGAILSSIKSLLKNYVKYPLNSMRSNRLIDFQIEISEAEEMSKHIYLKKESDSLVLYASKGFYFSEPIVFSCGGEVYCSRGEAFKHFKSKQDFGLFREHSKIIQKEVSPVDKIISNEELVSINNQTKHINDAFIEAYINTKGKVRVSHIEILDSGVEQFKELGYVIYKSSRKYDRISLVNLRDSSSYESMNPLYLLIKSFDEVLEFTRNIHKLSNFDGVIFTYPYYSSLLESIGKYYDKDILYYSESLDKSLDVGIDWDSITIEGAKKLSQNTANPFNHIIGEENKKKDALLEQLKSIDLSTPQEHRYQRGELENAASIANQIISSPNSSTRKQSSLNWPSAPSKSVGEKKSAIDFLMDSAMHHEKEISNQAENVEPSYQQQSNLNQTQVSKTEPETDNFFMSNPFGDEGSNLSKESVDDQKKTYSEETLSRYDSVLATVVLSPIPVSCSGYFISSSMLSQINPEKPLYVTVEDLSESSRLNKNVCIPLSQRSGSDSVEISYILKSVEDFFRMEESIKNHLFVDLTRVSDSIKRKYVLTLFAKFNNKVSFIVSKYENRDFLELVVGKVYGLVPIDIENQEEYNSFKNLVLALEKKKLLNLLE